MVNNTFLLLGNQLFDPQLLKDRGCKRVFMAEDYSLCTYEKHHKLKIYLYLCAMREYKDELQRNGIQVCLLYTSPSPRDRLLSRMPSSA